MKQIHITGMSCRLPGAGNIDSLADLLYGNACAVTRIPDDRWHSAYLLHPKPGTKGKSYSFAAGVIDDVWGFDPDPFGLAPREATQMDPQQRVLLQVAYEALEDAGLPFDSLAGKNVGVYVGASSLDYSARLSADGMTVDAFTMTGNTLSLVSNRISHVFGFTGPSLTVDTACSSSLVALNEAEKALALGTIDIAIVGGVNLLLSPVPFIGFSAARMLSPTGLCRPFSSAADGYVRGEGAVAVVLQALPPTHRTRSYGRLAGVATNSDGRTTNVALPSAKGQGALIETLYAQTGIDPEDLAFVEAHGTGTAVGDPIEAEALGRTLGRRRRTPLPIGSIKSNIGHLEPASGLAGLVKLLIALERRELPASLHAGDLNEAIDFDDLNLVVARRNLPLPLDDNVRFAGISSFGFGGTNVHAIIEKSATAPVQPQPVQQSGAGPSTLIISAASEAALRGLAADYRAQVKTVGDDGLAAWCSQAAHFRGRHHERLAVLGNSVEAIGGGLDSFLAGSRDARFVQGRSRRADEPVVFVYSGNGSQYPGMSLAALEADDAYAEAYHDIDRRFLDLSGISLVETLKNPDLRDLLDKTEFAQPLLFADQVALTRALAARGLVPAATLGHSAGEVAASHGAGALDLDQAVRMIHFRCQAQMQLEGLGTMAALQASEEAARDILQTGDYPDITIAAVNSPRSVTMVGPREAVSAFIRDVRRIHRLAAVPLAMNYPYHSPLQDRIQDQLRSDLTFLNPVDGERPFYSTVIGGVVSGQLLDVDYWWAMVRQPVQFAPAINAAAGAGYRAFLEIGSQPVLTGYIKDCLQETAPSATVVHSLQKSDTSAVNPVARAFSQAVIAGCRVRRDITWPRPGRVEARLPTYHWNNQTYRQDQTPAIEQFYGVEERQHQLLGLKVDMASDEWKNTVDLDVLSAFKDHVIGRNVLAPGTFFIELALASAQRTLSADRVAVRNLDIVTPLTLTSGNLVQVRTLVSRKSSGVQVLSVPLSDPDTRRVHATGSFGRAPEHVAADPAPGLDRQAGDCEGWELYHYASVVGLDYGPDFQRLSHYRRVGQDTWDVVLTDCGGSDLDLSRLAIDPVGVDAVFHGVVAALMARPDLTKSMGYVPIHVGRTILAKPGVAVASGRVAVRKVGKRSVLADICCFDTDGALTLRLEGVRFRAVRLLQDVDFDTAAISIETVPADGPLSPDLYDTWHEAVETRGFDPRFAPDDDSHLLIEAAAQRLLYDTMQTIRPDASQDPLYLHAVDTLVSARLLSRHEGESHLAEDCPLPEATDILNALVDENPALVPQVAVLARLGEILPERLGSADGIDPVACFGRDALENLYEGSVYEARRRAWFSAALGDMLARFGGRRIRIAEIIGGKTPIMPSVLQEFHDLNVDLVQINAELAGESVARTKGTLWHHGPCETLDARYEPVAGQKPFDLVVANGNLHMVDDIDRVLSNVAAMLKPGAAILSLNQGPSDFLETVSRLAGGNDSAPSFLGATRLSRLADAAGLNGSSTRTLPEGFGSAYWMIARKPQADASVQAEGTEALKHAILSVLQSPTPDDADAGLGLKVAENIDAGGTKVTVLGVRPVSGGEDAAALLAKRISYLATRLRKARPDHAPLWFLFPGPDGQPHTDAGQAAVNAFLRTARNEFPGLGIHCVDMPSDAHATAAIDRLTALIRAGTGETELVLGVDGLSIRRAALGLEGGAKTDGSPDQAVFTLALPETGRLNDLSWQARPRTGLGDKDVRIKVAAAGLNYRDVMWTLGILPEEALESGFAGSTLGIECAGVVAEVGAGVRDLSVGDPVMTFGPNCLSTEVTINRKWVHNLPPGADLKAAATMPVAFFTAFYALHQLARLGMGETVLIHGGAGGVGLAAIQIAQWCGAKVIATAGSSAKRAFLRQYGVEHVLDSRSLEFATEIRDLTGGRGVDVVLNSLAGEAMELSLQALAPFGRFLELGKQDFYLNTEIGLRPLKENIAYFGIDVDQLLAARPELAARVFSEMLERFTAGDFVPLPHRSFGGSEVVNAFRLMQRSGHIGKIVVDPSDLRGRGGQTTGFAADPDGAHLVIGGLGGLGVRTAEWLAQKGARHLVLVSRRAKPDAASLQRIERMRQLGIRVDLSACDIAVPDQVAKLIKGLRTRARIAGVLHAAMELDDAPIAELDAARITRSLAAKVAGLSHLDAETGGDTLDYFVAFSSIATLIGNHGQSAYVAANGFVEGLMRQRHDRGQPALAIGLGPISDAGYLTRDAAKASLMRRMSGGIDFTTRQALSALDRLMSRPRHLTSPVVYVSPMNWLNVTTVLPTLREPMLEKLRLLGEQAGTAPQADDLRDAILAMLPKDAEQHLVKYLVRQIVQILHIPEAALPVDQPISELGMDSLMGVELGLGIQEALGSDISMASIAGDQTIRAIARALVAHVQSGQQDGITGDRLRDNLAAQHLTGEAVAASNSEMAK